MMTIVLTAVPPGLRGDLTKWLVEISSGVFVGSVSARVRDQLWARVVSDIRRGRAVLVYPASNEQGLTFRVHHSEWEPVDFDGLTLMRRPHASGLQTKDEPERPWSLARARLKSSQPNWGITSEVDKLLDETHTDEKNA